MAEEQKEETTRFNEVDEYREFFERVLADYLSQLPEKTVAKLLDELRDIEEAFAKHFSNLRTQEIYSPASIPNAGGGMPDEKSSHLDGPIPNIAMQEIREGLKKKDINKLLPYLLMQDPVFYPNLTPDNHFHGRTLNASDNPPAGQDRSSALKNRVLVEFRNVFMNGEFGEQLNKANRDMIIKIKKQNQHTEKVNQMLVRNLMENFREKYSAGEYFTANHCMVQISTYLNLRQGIHDQQSIGIEGEAPASSSVAEFQMDAGFLIPMIQSLSDLNAPGEAASLSMRLMRQARNREDKYKYLPTCLRALREEYRAIKTLNYLRDTVKYGVYELDILTGLNELTIEQCEGVDEKYKLLPQLNEKHILLLTPMTLSELYVLSTQSTVGLCTALDHTYYALKLLKQSLADEIRKTGDPQAKQKIAVDLKLQTLKLKLIEERYEEVVNHIFLRLTQREEKDEVAIETPEFDRCVAYYLRARMYQALKKSKEALDDITKAIAFKPGEFDKKYPELYIELLIQYATVSHIQIEDMMGKEKGLNIGTLDEFENIVRKFYKEMTEGVPALLPEHVNAKSLEDFKEKCKVETKEQCAQLLENIHLYKRLFLDVTDKLNNLLNDVCRNNAHFGTIQRIRNQFVKLRAKLAGKHKEAYEAAMQTAEVGRTREISSFVAYMNAAYAAWFQSRTETESSKRRLWEKNAENALSKAVVYKIGPEIPKEFARLVELVSIVQKEKGEISLSTCTKISKLKHLLMSRPNAKGIVEYIKPLPASFFQNKNEYALLKIARWVIDHMRTTTDYAKFHVCAQILGAVQEKISVSACLPFRQVNIVHLLAVQDPTSNLKDIESYYFGLTGNVDALISVCHNLSINFQGLKGLKTGPLADLNIQALFKLLADKQFEECLHTLIWKPEFIYLMGVLQAVQCNSLTPDQRELVSNALTLMQGVRQNILNGVNGNKKVIKTTPLSLIVVMPADEEGQNKRKSQESLCSPQSAPLLKSRGLFGREPSSLSASSWKESSRVMMKVDSEAMKIASF